MIFEDLNFATKKSTNPFLRGLVLAAWGNYSAPGVLRAIIRL